MTTLDIFFFFLVARSEALIDIVRKRWCSLLVVLLLLLTVIVDGFSVCENVLYYTIITTSGCNNECTCCSSQKQYVKNILFVRTYNPLTRFTSKKPAASFWKNSNRNQDPSKDLYSIQPKTTTALINIYYSSSMVRDNSQYISSLFCNSCDSTSEQNLRIWLCTVLYLLFYMHLPENSPKPQNFPLIFFESQLVHTVLLLLN